MRIVNVTQSKLPKAVKAVTVQDSDDTFVVVMNNRKGVNCGKIQKKS